MQMPLFTKWYFSLSQQTIALIWWCHYLTCAIFNLLSSLSHFLFTVFLLRLGFQDGTVVNNLIPCQWHKKQEMSLIPGQTTPENEMITHSSIPCLKIPWIEEPSRLYYGLTKSWHDWAILSAVHSLQSGPYFAPNDSKYARLSSFPKVSGCSWPMHCIPSQPSPSPSDALFPSAPIISQCQGLCHESAVHIRRPKYWASALQHLWYLCQSMTPRSLQHYSSKASTLGTLPYLQSSSPQP